MRIGELEIDMVRRHVRQGAVIVARQEQLITRLRATGYPSEFAEKVLISFLEIQTEHVTHLQRLTTAPAFRPFRPWWQRRV